MTQINGHQAIKNAIQKIALHGIVSQSTGAIVGSEIITGYVTKIHVDGDLAGTIDVQEYSSYLFDNTEDTKTGYHEGVYLSAIQNNSNGLLIIPKLYSDVTIVTDPDTKVQYVSMFSHVDIIQIDSHEKITVGVTEREEYDAKNEDSPDIHELEPTGVFAKTTYTKDSVITEVQGEDDSNKTVQTIDEKQYNIVVGDNKSVELIDQSKISLKHDKSEILLDDSSSTIKHGSSSVTVNNGTVYLGSDSGTDDAVLGSELATILMDMLNYCSQIKTTTQLGPQPPLNMAQFIALKAKINTFKNSHSGFLTKKVQVQK